MGRQRQTKPHHRRLARAPCTTIQPLTLLLALTFSTKFSQPQPTSNISAHAAPGCMVPFQHVPKHTTKVTTTFNMHAMADGWQSYTRPASCGPVGLINAWPVGHLALVASQLRYSKLRERAQSGSSVTVATCGWHTQIAPACRFHTQIAHAHIAHTDCTHKFAHTNGTHTHTHTHAHTHIDRTHTWHTQDRTHTHRSVHACRWHTQIAHTQIAHMDRTHK